MRRQLIAALSILLVLSSSAPAEDDFKKAKSELESAMNPEKPAADRLAGVYRVGLFDTKDSVSLLVRVINAEDRILALLLERKAKIDEQVQALLGEQILAEKRSLPSKNGKDLRGEVRRMRREAADLSVKIDEEYKVLESIAVGLERTENEKAIKYLADSALSNAKTWRAREIVARALGEIGNERTVKFLVKALGDRDDRVKGAAALSLGKMRAKAALRPLIALLEEKNWVVRAAAIEALGEIGEKGAVKPLIDRIGEEEGRLKDDCAKALTKLTGQKFGQADGLWRKWWKEHAHEYGGEEGTPLGGYPPDVPKDAGKGYYGIPIVTMKPIFVLDVSGSMSKSEKDSNRDPGAGEVSKIEKARRELTRAVKGLSKKGVFNIIIFNDVVKRWQNGMVKSNAKNKAAAEKWIATLGAKSSTNIYDALQEAFKVAGMGVNDRHYKVESDTIFLLSDGSPTKPTGELDDWEKILRAVKEWNRLKKVTIHTIGVGGHNVAFMSRLAAENNGRYVAR
jgi:hypothetical protein